MKLLKACQYSGLYGCGRVSGHWQGGLMWPSNRIGDYRPNFTERRAKNRYWAPPNAGLFQLIGSLKYPTRACIRPRREEPPLEEGERPQVGRYGLLLYTRYTFQRSAIGRRAVPTTHSLCTLHILVCTYVLRIIPVFYIY